MARIIDWTVEDPKREFSKRGFYRLVAEADEDGVVSRELAFDDDGRLFHRYPGTGRYGDRGFFDVTPVDPQGPSDLAIEEFERLWRTDGLEA